MKFSDELLNYVVDGDLHTKLTNVEFSTSPREIITVRDMCDRNFEGGEIGGKN